MILLYSFPAPQVFIKQLKLIFKNYFLPKVIYLSFHPKLIVAVNKKIL